MGGSGGYRHQRLRTALNAVALAAASSRRMAAGENRRRRAAAPDRRSARRRRIENGGGWRHQNASRGGDRQKSSTHAARAHGGGKMAALARCAHSSARINAHHALPAHSPMRRRRETRSLPPARAIGLPRQASARQAIMAAR